MWKKLFLSEVDPMKALERSLLRAREKYCSENQGSMSGTTLIIIKKKKVIKHD